MPKSAASIVPVHRRRLKALLAAMLLALAVGLLHRRADSPTPGAEIDASVPLSDRSCPAEVTSSAAFRSPLGQAEAPSSKVTQVESSPEEEVVEGADPVEPPPEQDLRGEGFLCRSPNGLLLKQPILVDGDDGDCWPTDETFLWSVEGIKSLPIADSNDFRPFLNGEAGSGTVPVVYVTVGPRANPEGGDAVVVVTSCEILTPAWLEAFRDLARLGNRFHSAVNQPPGNVRRAALLEVAGALEGALARAQQARAGEEPSDWRRGREQGFSSWIPGKVAELTSPPQDRATNALLRKSETLDALCRNLEANYSKANTPQWIGMFRRDASPGGDPGIVFVPTGQHLQILLGWTEEEYALFRKEQIDLEAESSLSGGAKSGVPGKDSILGLDFVPLSRDECSSLAMEAGIRVTRVEPGGPAALAGLQADDIIWEVDGEIRFDDLDPDPFIHTRDGSEVRQWSVRAARAGNGVDLTISLDARRP